MRLTLLGWLDVVLDRDGYVIFICGGKEKGKTDFALFLGEYSFFMGYRTKIATNIKAETPDYSIRQITNLPDLKEWLRGSGRKLFILDEAGMHVGKLRFMTQKNIEILKILQLIRHYDAGFIGCAPSESFIDNNFLNTDILDAKIRKLSKKKAKVYNYLHRESSFLFDIPPTSTRFNSKDIASFSMTKKTDLSAMQECCRVFYLYAQGYTFRDIGNTFDPPKNPKLVQDLMRKHGKHMLPVTSHQEG